MNLNIIRGKSGSGKTAKLLNYADAGDDNLIITTEPSVYYIQKTMAEKGIPCVVTGHSGAAKAVLDVLNKPARKELKREAQSVIIANIIDENRDELKALTDASCAGGTPDRIQGIIGELKQQDLSPADIMRVADTTAGTTHEKMNDIAVIYREFEKIRAELGFSTSEDILMDAVQALKECNSFPYKNVIIDSAEEYTPHYRELIKAFVGKTENLSAAFRSTSPKAYDYEICKESMDTAVELADRAEKEDDCTINIEELKRPKDASGGIGIIEKELFNRDTETVSDSDSVMLHEASSMYKEADFVASQIKKLVAEKKVAPEDIIVTSSTVDRYINIISSAFLKNGISFFYYKDTSLSKTYLFDFVSTVLDAVISGYSVKTLARLAQFSYLGIEKKEFSMFDSFFTRFGHMMDTAMKNGEKYDKENCDAVKALVARIMDGTEPLTAVSKGETTAREIMCAIMSYLNSMSVQKQVIETYNGFIRDAEMQEAEKVKASWNKMAEVFDDINSIFGDKPITLNKFADIFAKMAEETIISVTQQFYGQVSIIGLKQAQSRKSKYLFVIGCNEGYFPENPSKPFIDDHERRVINLELDTDLRMSEKTDTMNRAAIYSTLTMPSERLCVSWSLNDIDSKQMRHASIIANVVKTFGQNIVKEMDYYNSDKEEAFIRLISDVAAYRESGKKAEKLDERYMEFILDKNYSERLYRAVRSACVDMKKINAENTADAYRENDFFAVTRLEKFGECPFKHFIDYGLKPSRIKIFDETATDRGNYFHDVMKEFFDCIIKEGRDIDTLTKSEFNSIINPIMDRLAADHNDGIFDTTGRFTYEAGKIKRRIRISAWQTVCQLNQGSFEPVKGEYAVGREIPLDIVLDSGKTAHIVGKIDRLDVADTPGGRFARVIDYKSGNVAFSEELLAGGVQLQLPLYSKAVSTEDNSAGMYYFHIQDPVIDADNERDSIEKRFQMSGPTAEDTDAITATDTGLVDPSYSSNVAALETTTKGALSKRSKVMTAKELDDVMDMAVKMAKENIDGILAGETTAYPFVHKQTNACDYCKYRSICHFDPSENGSQRHLEIAEEETKE